MTSLRGASVSLEPLLADHARELYPLLSDPRLYVHLDAAPPTSEAALETRFRKLETRRSPDGTQLWLNWLVRSRAEEPLGYVQATVLPGNTAAWIAYVIGHAHQGNGFGREATALMCDHLRADYGVRRLLASVESANTPSRRLLEALGFGVATSDEAAGHDLSPTERLYVDRSRPGYAPRADHPGPATAGPA